MKISIPEPCSEDWSKMTPNEQGAFCQKCALEVTDFTNKSSLEIKSILTEKIQSKQRVCGHIENRQMVEFNHEFIPWKNDQESFRAIWMFSLVAVFGLTLFSCQSTFSKEVVEKMNTRSEQMIESENDTLDVAKLNDSINMMNTQDSLLPFVSDPWDIIKPWDVTGGPVITNGGFGVESIITEVQYITCIPGWTGTLVTLGGFSPAPGEEDQINISNFFSPFSPTETTIPLSESPRINEQNQNNGQRLNAKLEKGRPEFEAYISPLPIDKSSKLFVTIPEEGSLKLSIWEIPSLGKIHSETFDLVFGNHSIDINFHDFANGKYAVQLNWEEEKLVIPFEVISEKIS
ncbi:MAG: hypothetical protein P8P74_11450 [Crocinitomicaceae bacterium]|nr:hypothetical protein [Crocinitomicaceae bacterium]